MTFDAVSAIETFDEVEREFRRLANDYPTVDVLLIDSECDINVYSEMCPSVPTGFPSLHKRKYERNDFPTSWRWPPARWIVNDPTKLVRVRTVHERISATVYFTQFKQYFRSAFLAFLSLPIDFQEDMLGVHLYPEWWLEMGGPIEDLWTYWFEVVFNIAWKCPMQFGLAATQLVEEISPSFRSPQSVTTNSIDPRQAITIKVFPETEIPLSQWSGDNDFPLFWYSEITDFMKASVAAIRFIRNELKKLQPISEKHVAIQSIDLDPIAQCIHEALADLPYKQWPTSQDAPNWNKLKANKRIAWLLLCAKDRNTLISLSASDWGKKIGRTPSAVIKTPMWKVITKERCREQQSRPKSAISSFVDDSSEFGSMDD